MPHPSLPVRRGRAQVTNDRQPERELHHVGASRSSGQRSRRTGAARRERVSEYGSMSTPSSSRMWLATATMVAALGLAVAPVTYAAGAPVGAATTTAPASLTAAAKALQGGESVYVAPDADPSITTAEADQRAPRSRRPATRSSSPSCRLGGGRRIGRGDHPRAARRGGPRGHLRALPRGNTFIAGDTRGKVEHLATVAYRENKDAGAVRRAHRVRRGARRARHREVRRVPVEHAADR